jgi:hypothetical protein
MATDSNTSQGSGALASVTGFFGNLVNQATPVLSSYLEYKGAKENAKANLGAGYAGGNTNSAGNTSGAPAPSSASITSRPWFSFAVGGVILAVLGFGFLALRGKK